jgi:hypothetical protein
MSAACWQRDGERCVLTGDAPAPKWIECKYQALHILSAANSSRLLCAGTQIQPQLLPHIPVSWIGSDGKLLRDYAFPLPFADEYDPRLALTMLTRFNALWRNGQMWCDESGRVRFSQAAVAAEAELKSLDGKLLRVPTTAQAKALWPPPLVFELQRLLAPHFQARCNNPSPSPSSSSPSATTSSSPTAASTPSKTRRAS